jgi:hypothetical protein
VGGRLIRSSKSAALEVGEVGSPACRRQPSPLKVLQETQELPCLAGWGKRRAGPSAEGPFLCRRLFAGLHLHVFGGV